MKTKGTECVARIEEPRHGLIERGFRCLSCGRFGIPSHSDVEVWAKGAVLVYLLYDGETGEWDLLRSIDQTNSTASTWKNLDAMLAKGVA